LQKGSLVLKAIDDKLTSTDSEIKVQYASNSSFFTCCKSSTFCISSKALFKAPTALGALLFGATHPVFRQHCCWLADSCRSPRSYTWSHGKRSRTDSREDVRKILHQLLALVTKAPADSC
jgi:hypothetical protein